MRSPRHSTRQARRRRAEAATPRRTGRGPRQRRGERRADPHAHGAAKALNFTHFVIIIHSLWHTIDSDRLGDMH